MADIVSPEIQFKDRQTVVPLTNANGTGDDTIVDVGGTFNQVTLNNNLRDLSDKINEIITALQNVGILT